MACQMDSGPWTCQPRKYLPRCPSRPWGRHHKLILARQVAFRLCTVLSSCGYRCLQDQLQSGRYAGDLRLYILKSNSVRQLDFCLTFFHSCWKLPILIALVQSVVQRRDWLMLVAVHSDTWLYAVAFYNGARLDKNGRYGTAQKCERVPFRAPTFILTGRVIVGRNFLT